MELYAPIKAQIQEPVSKKTMTVMLGASKVADIDGDNLLQVVKLTAGIVDGFAKGWHPDTITQVGDRITITAKKD